METCKTSGTGREIKSDPTEVSVLHKTTHYCFNYFLVGRKIKAEKNNSLTAMSTHLSFCTYEACDVKAI
jgi:hypothetical protein